MATRENLIVELQSLLRLTSTEAAIATVRRAQARTDALQAELAANADKARERMTLISQAIRELGGAPDVVNPALGKAAAFTKTQFEAAQAFPTALLGDLQLEHQLRERARFVRTMAEQAGERSVVKVMERLDLAHTKTIEWLETRLAEVAQGGPSQLRALPTQVAVGALRTALVVPMRGIAAVVNRSAGVIQSMRGAVPQQVTDVASAAAGKLSRGGERTIDLTVEGARAAGAAVDEGAAAAAGVSATDLPIKSYDTLNVDEIKTRLGRLSDVDDVHTVLAYELAHKDRKGVTEAAHDRLTELAAEKVPTS